MEKKEANSGRGSPTFDSDANGNRSGKENGRGVVKKTNNCARPPSPPPPMITPSVTSSASTIALSSPRSGPSTLSKTQGDNENKTKNVYRMKRGETDADYDKNYNDISKSEKQCEKSKQVAESDGGGCCLVA